MRKFEVGDRVRVNLPGSSNHGKETVITWIGQGPVILLDGSVFYCFHYQVDLVSRNGNTAGFEAHELIPIYDGNEKVSWSECAWKPKELVKL